MILQALPNLSACARVGKYSISTPSHQDLGKLCTLDMWMENRATHRRHLGWAWLPSMVILGLVKYDVLRYEGDEGTRGTKGCQEGENNINPCQ